MKNMSKLFFASLLLFIFSSCDKDENKIYFEGGTAPVLTSSVTATIPLSFANADKEAIRLSWTNPDYKFTTGVSSQNVSYLLEIDTTGANFTNPKKKTLVIASGLSKSITQAELNDYLLNTMELKSAVPHNIEMRITASLSGNSVSLSSNVLKFTVTPYSIPPKVTPPTNGTLWITGDAAPSGWSNPLGAPHNQSQKFTQVSPTLYELTLSMPGGGNYKLIQIQGDWGSQYHMLDGGTWEGGDFEKKDADPGFPGPPSAGTYKITVDFQRGKFTVIKL
jgi:hypothetical protein